MPLAARLLIACGLALAPALLSPGPALFAQEAGPAPGPAAAEAPAAPGGGLFGGEPWLMGLTLGDLLVIAAPFLVASLIALWFGVERLVVLRPGRVIPKEFVSRFLNLVESGRISPEEAREICEENGSPVAEVFRHAVKKSGRPAMEVEQAVIDGGARQVSHLRKHLRVLNAVATVSPLMGLLGTVIGMILAFAKIAGGEGAMGDADQLAAGIVTALLTTALGLTVAIPALTLYFYLSGRVESLVMRMDELAERIVEAVAREEDEAAPDAPAPKPPPAPHRPGPPNGRSPVKAAPGLTRQPAGKDV
ncbi:MotA/TolQ/ExbB proton channel family protein [Alienimonas californiensis]|uniref:Biopolymer transport protein ExbB n=1 Tax=Alienimonas californiensis TaxID=2527989 RepID=A0A517P4J4_9PLAN|nr:MotA/TolQ/ExbB proton channel family protein [Alienimonas californiensis]QDT14312.1 Biopolymer transport protein ExbB [Alienimonas californiensis]